MALAAGLAGSDKEAKHLIAENGARLDGAPLKNLRQSCSTGNGVVVQGR
jgi:hypothetical protein